MSHVTSFIILIIAFLFILACLVSTFFCYCREYNGYRTALLQQQLEYETEQKQQEQAEKEKAEKEAEANRKAAEEKAKEEEEEQAKAMLRKRQAVNVAAYIFE